MKPLRFHRRNLARHGVDEEEIRQCFSNRHFIFKNPRGGIKEYKVIGKTDAGRYLEFVYEDKGIHWFAFTAMPARTGDVTLFRR